MTHPRTKLRHIRFRKPAMPAVVGLLFGATFWSPGSANAQVLSEYLPDTSRGAGELWQDPKQMRLSREFEPQGLHLGGFRLSGDATENVGYIDNANRLPGGVPSAVISTTAQLGLASDWTSDRLYANASVADTRYLDQSIENQTNWTTTVGGFHDVGHQRIGFDYAHLNLVQTPTTLGGLASVQPIKYKVDRLDISDTLARVDRFSLIPDASITNFSFNHGAILPSDDRVSVSQTYRNRAIIVENLTARYRLTPVATSLLVLRGTEVRYTSSLAGYPGRDSNGAAVLAGLDYDTSHLINLRFLAGYQRRIYRNSFYHNFGSPILESQASWTPSRLTQIDFTANHGIEDSAFENTAGFTYTTLRLDIKHQYQRDIFLSSYFMFQHGKYQDGAPNLIGSILSQPGGHQTILGGGISAQWLINRHMDVTMSYDISQQNVVGSLGNFVLNQIMFKIDCKL